jgi:hypothetical protein
MKTYSGDFHGFSPATDLIRVGLLQLPNVASTDAIACLHLQMFYVEL